MKQFPPLLVFVWLIVVAACCHKQQISNELEEKPHWFSTYKFFDNEEYSQYLQNHITALDSNAVIFCNSVKAFYAETGMPIWTANGWQEARIDSIMYLLSHAAEQGIQPSFFGYERLCQKIAAVKSLEIKEEVALYDSLSQIEVLLTHAYLTYAKSMVYGATDPVLVNGGKWLFRPDSISFDFPIATLRATDSATNYLRQLPPTDSNYVALQRELCKYLALCDSVFPHIPAIEADSGKAAKGVRLIGERLKLTGELAPNYPLTDTLTPTLMAAIQLFRTNHAIPTSKKLDEETLLALNRSAQYYIDKLSANLERYRWQATRHKEESFIAVNIADFSLQLHHADSVVQMKVCCGKSPAPQGNDTLRKNGILRSQSTETPLLRSGINYLVINPIWSIPYSIVRDEYYYKLVRSNISVVKKERLHIIDGRTQKEVRPESIDWKKVPRGNIPYRIFQESGRFNALGLVKFNFPNTESVYLHDTNNKGAFKRRVRALSHGCVRVEKPIALATQLLTINGYDSTQLEQILIRLGNEPITEEGNQFLAELQEKEAEYYAKLLPEDTIFYRPIRPTTLSLSQKMPVYLEYYTCFLGQNGYVQYRPDVYRKENNILYHVK